MDVQPRSRNRRGASGGPPPRGKTSFRRPISLADYVGVVSHELDKPLTALARPFDSDTDGSEAIHELCVMPFLKLLRDPLGPEVAAKWEIDGSDLGQRLQLAAVGVHSAGRRLPRGRHSDLFVARAAVLQSRQTHGAAESHSAALFLAMFHRAHALLFGRQQTLIHAILHSANDKGLVVEIPLTPSASVTTSRRSMALGYSFERLQFPADAHLLLADASVLEKLALVAWDNSHTKDTGDRVQEQLALLRANRVVDRLKTEQDQTARWYCMYHTLLKNTAKTVAILEDGHSVGIVNTLYRLLADPNLVIQGQGDTESHLRTVAIERAVRMLQLFFLYREFCGQWFYILVPPDQHDLRMCFTIGAHRQLAPPDLELLAALARNVRNRARVYLTELGTQVSQPGFDTGTQRSATKRLLAGTFQALSATGLNFEHRVRTTEDDDKTPVAAGLPAYLAFCERVAEQAVHEGKKLHFDIIVCDGYFASERLTRLSELPGKAREWAIARESDETFFAEEQHISRLLGNYAFMQPSGVVLQGTHEGRLLSLCSVLPDYRTPEQLTADSESYLVRVVETGDICVYFRGNLVLWRRSGEYIVPELYGRAYRARLTEWLTNQFPSHHADVDFDVIAETVWDISANRRGGCTFVLGTMSDGPFKVENFSYPLTDIFPFAEGAPLASREGASLLQQLAVQDGATIIDTFTGAVYGRRQLAPLPINWVRESEQWSGVGDQRWDDWHKVLRWGTRHHSALALAASASVDATAATSAVVITVSSDADIHVFRGRRPEFDLTYPRAARGTQP